jgi:hypothetical protein
VAGTASGTYCCSAAVGAIRERSDELRGPRGPGCTLYVNTGIWIPLWHKDRPDLAGRVFYSVARFTRRSGEYGHENLVWDDILRAVRPALMLTPDRRPRRTTPTAR